MNTLSTVSQKPSRLHPLSLFVQLTSRQVSGCLRVTSESTSWLIYLVQGKLTFASHSMNPFERLDRHLDQLSQQVPTLVSAIREQVRSLFEPIAETPAPVTADYQAIYWLFEQQFLSQEQVATLIEALAKEVIESFLKVTEGNYEFIERESIVGFPSLCYLELRPLVEACQARLRRQAVARAAGALTSPPTAPTPQLTTAPSSTLSNTSIATPAPVETLDTSEVSTDSPDEPPTVAKPKGHYTIACIDDSPAVLQAIRSFLDDSNLAIVMINDPLKALIQVVRSKPDLVLLDVGMPNLDGYELCALLRRHSSFKNTPIVMVTGHTGFIDRAKAKLVGASGYLSKPFTQPELVKIVFKYLK